MSTPEHHGIKVALLSAGPSLRKTFDPDAGHTVRIGVNSAVELCECEWWAAGDMLAIQKIKPVGRPGIYTKRTTLDRMETRFPDLLDGRPTLTWADAVDGLGSMPAGWSVYSATAALVLAAHLQAESVDVFGVDMEGDLDHAGRQGENRSENRWSNERNVWNQMVRWVESLGVAVTRHAPATAGSPNAPAAAP